MGYRSDACAHAGNAAARKALGFSPAGAHFAFEQYTQLCDATEIVAEIQVIDTRTDGFANGTPFAVRTKDDDEYEDSMPARTGASWR